VVGRQTPTRDDPSLAIVTSRDRAVIAALLVLLGILSAPVLLPATSLTGDASPSVAPSAEPGRAYREGFVGQPTSVSPFGAMSAADRTLVALTFAGLVRLGPSGTYVPDLAASWSEDPTGASYTFELRDDATWQDGEPVTAHDVEFTIDALKDPTYTGPGASSWRDVTVTVVGPTTVRFDLGDPIAGFLAAATQPVAPAHLLEGVSPADLPSDPFGQAPVGNGRYRLLSWNAGEALLEAVPTPSASVEPSPTPTVDSLRTAGLPSMVPGTSLSRIEFRFSDDPSSLVAAFRAGELDAVSGLPPAMAAELGAEPGSKLLRYPRTTLTSVVFDLRAGVSTFQDARVRRGLLEASDRDAIVAGAMAGLAARADSLVPATFWAYDAAASPDVGHDPAAAARDLAAGGWRKESGGWLWPGAKSGATLRLLCPEVTSNPVACAVADAVASGWQAVGVTVSVEPLPPAQLARRLRSGDFDAAVVDIALGLDPDLYPLLASSQAAAGGANVSGLQDPRLDELLTAARKPGDDASRRAAWRDLQTYLTERSFVLPIAFRDEAVVARDALSGPSIQPIGDGSDRFYDVLTWRLADDR
jgi:peptide/nickel transport system substrate-binding protein